MSLTIVTAHWKEDLTWLLKSKFPVVLIDKEGADPSPFVPQHVIPNVGLDAAAYCKYIFENYDNLPDHVAFIHGHETRYHQQHDRPLLEVIEGVNREKYGFVPINNAHCAGGFADSTEKLRLASLYAALCIPAPKPLPGDPMIFENGAQFVVSKERIRRNPKMLYEGWLHVMLTNPEISNEISIILEHFWHVIFGQDFVNSPQKDWFLFDWQLRRAVAPDSCVRGEIINYW